MFNILGCLIKTEKDFSTFVLRVLLGIVMFAHGAQKIFGLFGGFMATNFIAFLTDVLRIQLYLAFLSIVVEFLGSIALISGFLTRIAAFGIACLMIAAALMVHVQYGFFMNWTGDKEGEGFEYHILAIAIAVALIIRGGGLWSLDRSIYYKRR